ncbi:MAG: hypothetical protein MK212_15020 [Saprospiraceae bacterium]|nr:hypothetical protein [Saprospiraceae bacterium]
MAEFIAFNNAVEVNERTILSFVNSTKKGKEQRVAMLKKSGIALDGTVWYPVQHWLDAFKDLSDNIGEIDLFFIGRAIIENAEFPPMKDLQEALASIDFAYHMNHRVNGQVMFDAETGTMLDGIGHYTLVSFDAAARKAVMKCENPYPSKFDQGIIDKVTELFKPATSKEYQVSIDSTKERRTRGAESCTYLIHW